MELACPVCLELPAGQWHQCCNGHSMCGTCWAKLDPRRCPECRQQPLPPSNRNLERERAIDALPEVRRGRAHPRYPRRAPAHAHDRTYQVCADCGEATTRGTHAAHERACPKRQRHCACGWRGLLADVATHEATCAHAICEKVVAPLKQENLKLRHKLAEACSTITKTLEPEIQRLRAETLILLSSQTVIRSDAESIRVRVEALEEEPIPPPARTDPAIMSRIAALEGGRREERTPVEDDGDEECGHRHRRMRLWEPHY
jgi:hypothetical protein